MSGSTLVSPPPPAPAVEPRWARSRHRTHDRARWLLLVGWTVLLGNVVVWCPRPGTFDALMADVSTGQVDSVQVDTLAPGSIGGTVAQQVVWRDGVVLRRAPVVSGRGEAHHFGHRAGVSMLPVDDVYTRLHALEPDLRISRGEYDENESQVYGWYVPSTVGFVSLVMIFATLLVLVRDPRPRWATRWAWFWLMTVPPGTLLFLALAGPTPGIPAPRPGRRPLRAGWAIVIATVAAAFLPTWWPSD